MNIQQAPYSILMIRPAAFFYNQETSLSNRFQQVPGLDHKQIQAQALQEFDAMVALLRDHRMDVLVKEDLPLPPKPDAIFPNNWISFHPDGKVIVYPMLAANRRAEVRMDIVEELKSTHDVKAIIDLTGEADQAVFLEGTGSMVFDYVNQVIYASRSPRTHESLVYRVAATLGYRVIVFNATDENGIPIYHTNVVMSIGSRFAVICLDAIHAEQDQDMLLDQLSASGHKVVAISYAQMLAFAGNCLEVLTSDGEPVVVMSEQAFASLLPGQLDAISRFADVLPVSIRTIETYGGGSVRCMMAGIYLQKRTP
jgi:hypothetical protein